jgi:hypothetical protein
MVSAERAMAAVLQVMTGPIVWGRSDCCAAACDVFALLHGVDPMAPLRGVYTSEAQALRLIRARGGWVQMCEGLARAALLVPGTGAAGELGLLCLDGRFTLAVGVGGGMFAVRIEGGFATTAGQVASWRN